MALSQSSQIIGMVAVSGAASQHLNSGDVDDDILDDALEVAGSGQKKNNGSD